MQHQTQLFKKVLLNDNAGFRWFIKQKQPKIDDPSSVTYGVRAKEVFREQSVFMCYLSPYYEIRNAHASRRIVLRLSENLPVWGRIFPKEFCRMTLGVHFNNYPDYIRRFDDLRNYSGIHLKGIQYD